MKLLYLHIGTPNTGSAAIRSFCEENRRELEREGYCFPGSSVDCQSLNRDPDSRAQIRRLFEKYENVILSDEELYLSACRRDSAYWKELCEEADEAGYRIRVIVYLRRQDAYVSAWWNRMIAENSVPLTQTWEEFCAHLPEDIQPDYDQVLSCLEEVLGRDAVIVRLFEPNRFFGGTIESDFLHCLGLKLTSDYTISKRLPEMEFAGNTHEIKRVLNTLSDIEASEDAFFRDVLMSCSDVSRKSYSAGMLSAEEFAAYMEPYLEGNRRIAREYFGEEDSLLFDMTYRDTEKWEKDNPWMVDDVIRFVGESDRLLMRMIDQKNEKLQEEREKAEAIEERIRKLESQEGILQKIFRRSK